MFARHGFPLGTSRLAAPSDPSGRRRHFVPPPKQVMGHVGSLLAPTTTSDRQLGAEAHETMERTVGMITRIGIASDVGTG